MRAIVWMLGTVAPLVLLGCVGAESETEATEGAADVGEAAAEFIYDNPTPHGRFVFVLSLCRIETRATPCLVWPPPIQVRAQ